MSLPSKPQQSKRSKISYWLWATLAGTVMLASGCATAPQQTARLERGAADSQDAIYDNADDIAILLRRLDQRKARASLNPAPPDDLGMGHEDFVAGALAHIGTRYKYGGSSPDAGFDCSGLVQYVARKSLGMQLPRSAAEQAKEGVHVARNELQRGDLVFFNTGGRRYSHVGIYLGGGSFVHSPSAGGKVRVEKMSMAYWNSRYNGARRLPGLTQLASSR